MAEQLLISTALVGMIRLSWCAWSGKRALTKAIALRGKPGSSAIIMAMKTGKSSLIQKLNSNGGGKLLIIDCDEEIKNVLGEQYTQYLDLKNSNNQTYKTLLYGKFKKWYDNLQSEFNDYRLILFMNDSDLANFIGIRDVISLAPTKQLHDQIKEDLIRNSRATDEEIKAMEADYLKIITTSKDLYHFNDFNNMANQVINSYKLKYSI